MGKRNNEERCCTAWRNSIRKSECYNNNPGLLWGSLTESCKNTFVNAYAVTEKVSEAIDTMSVVAYWFDSEWKLHRRTTSVKTNERATAITKNKVIKEELECIEAEILASGCSSEKGANRNISYQIKSASVLPVVALCWCAWSDVPYL